MLPAGEVGMRYRVFLCYQFLLPRYHSSVSFAEPRGFVENRGIEILFFTGMIGLDAMQLVWTENLEPPLWVMPTCSSVQCWHRPWGWCFGYCRSLETSDGVTMPEISVQYFILPSAGYLSACIWSRSLVRRVGGS